MMQPWPQAPDRGPEDAISQRRLAIGSFDARIMAYLDEHIEGERHLLAEYDTMLRECDHPPVRYLVGLLLEDEQRHHRILLEMLNQFRTSVYLAEQEPRGPWMTRRPDPAMAATTRRLRREERKDLRKLRSLRRHLGFMRRSSLDGVLVDALILDTRKHLRYLKTIQRLV